MSESRVPIPPDLLWRLRDHGLGRIGIPSRAEIIEVFNELDSQARRLNRAARHLRLHWNRQRWRMSVKGRRDLLALWDTKLGECAGVMRARNILYRACMEAEARDAELKAGVDEWVGGDSFQRAVSERMFNEAFGGDE